MKFEVIKSLKLNIRGIEYTCRLLNDRDYVILHGSDSDAVTISRSNTVDFKASTLSLLTVRHELGHAYFNSSLTETAELTPIQTEECMVEIWANFGERILQDSIKVFNVLNKKK